VLISLLSVSNLRVRIVILDSLLQVLKRGSRDRQMQGLNPSVLRRLSDLSSCIARDGYRIFAHTVSCFFVSHPSSHTAVWRSIFIYFCKLAQFAVVKLRLSTGR